MPFVQIGGAIIEKKLGNPIVEFLLFLTLHGDDSFRREEMDLFKKIGQGLPTLEYARRRLRELMEEFGEGPIGKPHLRFGNECSYCHFGEISHDGECDTCLKRAEPKQRPLFH